MRHDRLAVLTALEAQGVAPVFYHPDPQVCLNVIRACARGVAARRRRKRVAPSPWSCSEQARLGHARQICSRQCRAAWAKS